MNEPRISEPRISVDDQESWNDLVQRSSAPIFARRSWLEGLGEVLGGRARTLTCLWQERPFLGLSMLVRSRGPISYSPPLPFSMGNGLLCTCSEDGDTINLESRLGLSALCAEAERHLRMGHFLLPSHWMMEEQWPSVSWRMERGQTLVVVLDSEDAIQKRMSQSHRRKCRLAEKQGVQIIEQWDSAEMSRLFASSYAAHSLRAPFDDMQLKGILDLARHHGARMFLAMGREGSALAGRVVLQDGSRAYDLVAGDARVSQVSVSHFLVYRILVELLHSGAKDFDFMGANAPSIAQFKSGFGSTLAPMNTLHFHSSPMLRFAEKLRGGLRQSARRAIP